MLQRIRTSLTKPPMTVFFMKDSWGKVILYLFVMPLFLLLPLAISLLISTDMNPSRYLRLTTTIKTDFRISSAKIENGILSYETPATTEFDLFSLKLGSDAIAKLPLTVVFEENGLAVYALNYEIGRSSYEDLNLMNHDFSDDSNEEVYALSQGIKQLMDDNKILLIYDVTYTYIVAFYDYALISLLMVLVMLLFSFRLELSFKHRFKLSVYLCTVYIVIDLILTLFGLQYLNFLSILVVYVYHLWAYRSITAVPKGAV